MLKADLHIHTKHSIDSNMSYEQLISTCKNKGINCIAIADHGTTKGAKELSKIAPINVIISEEILTPYGEIMGMFLQEDIPNKLSVEETIKHIKEQNGLVCIPHPFDRIRPSAFRNLKMLEKIMDYIDIIEIFNARSIYPGIERKAKEIAMRFHKVMSAGSDAHCHLEIGYVIIEMQEFNSPQEFLNSLAQGRINAAKSSPLIHLLSTGARLGKKKV